MNLFTIISLYRADKISESEIPLFLDVEDEFDYKVLIDELISKSNFFIGDAIRQIIYWLAVHKPDKCQEVIEYMFFKDLNSIFEYNIFYCDELLKKQLNYLRSIISKRIKKVYDKEIIYVDLDDSSAIKLFGSNVFEDIISKERLIKLFDLLGSNNVYVVSANKKLDIYIEKDEVRRCKRLNVEINMENPVAIHCVNRRYEDRTRDLIEIVGRERYEKVLKFDTNLFIDFNVFLNKIKEVQL